MWPREPNRHKDFAFNKKSLKALTHGVNSFSDFGTYYGMLSNMSLLGIFKALFKASSPFTENADVLSTCMADIHSRLLSHLNLEMYKWDDDASVKKFECLIFSKAIIDHALLLTYADTLPKNKLSLYLAQLDTVFQSALEDLNKNNPAYKYDIFQDVIANRLQLYSSSLIDNPHPRCWQIACGVCTGIDYYSNKDAATLMSSSTFIPALFNYAQESLKFCMKHNPLC